MPTVYRIEVSEEGGQNGLDPSLAAAVTFDGKKTGELMPGEYQALLVGDEMKPLPHPLERSTLRAHNQTYLSASLGGILLQVERRICLQCGHIFDAPRVVFSGAAGCLPALLVASIAFAFLRFVLGLGTGVSLFISWTILMVVVVLFQWAGVLYIRARFSERQESIKRLKCPVCDGSNSVSVSSIAGKRVQIGTEGKWVQVSIAGKS
jgi:hypothetical protein